MIATFSSSLRANSLLLAVLGLLCIGTSTSVVASELRGMITDRETGSSIAGVTVRVSGTRLGATSDTSGRFRIANLTPGNYELFATRIGYERVVTKVFISRDHSTEDVVFTMLATNLVTQDVVISANRRVQAVQDVPLSVSTVTQADLSERNITQLDDALRYVSGVTVVKDQVNIRGSSGFAFGVGNRTMVLLDGFPLMSGDNGDIKFDAMPVADVERIEVIKGAGSALYGTGALGGVVSMITKPVTQENEFSARVYAGGYTQPEYPSWKYRSTTPLTGGVDVRLAKSIKNFTVSASAGIRSDDSYRDLDQQHRGFAYAKAQWKPSDGHQLTLFGLYALQIIQNYLYWKDLWNATRPTDSQDPNQLLQSDKLATAVEWQWIINERTSLTVRPGFFRTNFRNTLDNVEQDSNSSVAVSWNTDALLTTSVSSSTTVTAGLTGRVNTVSSDIYGEQLQTIASAFGQAELVTAGGPIVTAGLRVDHEHTASLSPHLEFSPKLGMSWDLSTAVSLRASAGRGFRAPTIAERYANIRYGPFRVHPNPNLLPESSWSFETGLHWTSSTWVVPVDVDIALFDNELFDLIEPRFDITDPSVPIVFKNITRARILGSELTVRSALGKTFTVETGLTAMLPRDLVLNQTLKYRNNILWYSRAICTPLSPLSLQLEYRFQNRVENIDDNLAVFIPDADQRVPSHVVDARVFWTFPANGASTVRLGIIARNVLDYYYAEAVANLSPTRSIVFQAEYH